MPETRPLHLEKMPEAFSECWGGTLKGVLSNQRLVNHLFYRKAVVANDPTYKGFDPENENVNISAVNLIKSGNFSTTLSSFLRTQGALAGYSYHEGEDVSCESFSTISFAPDHRVNLKYDKKTRQLKEIILEGEENISLNVRSRRTVTVVLDGTKPTQIKDKRVLTSFSLDSEAGEKVVFEKEYLWKNKTEAFSDEGASVNKTDGFNEQVGPDVSLIY